MASASVTLFAACALTLFVISGAFPHLSLKKEKSASGSSSYDQESCAKTESQNGAGYAAQEISSSISSQKDYAYDEKLEVEADVVGLVSGDKSCHEKKKPHKPDTYCAKPESHNGAGYAVKEISKDYAQEAQLEVEANIGGLVSGDKNCHEKKKPLHKVQKGLDVGAGLYSSGRSLKQEKEQEYSQQLEQQQYLNSQQDYSQQLGQQQYLNSEQEYSSSYQQEQSDYSSYEEEQQGLYGSGYKKRENEESSYQEEQNQSSSSSQQQLGPLGYSQQQQQESSSSKKGGQKKSSYEEEVGPNGYQKKEQEQSSNYQQQQHQKSSSSISAC